MHDAEFDRFKRDIPLLEYARERFGYARDRRESSIRCHVLRRETDDDKIVVRQDPGDGHWTYFSVRDGRDHGTIVDFIQHRLRANLGGVREELRRWLGLPRVSLPPAVEARARLPRPRLDPAVAFDAARIAQRCAYLEARGLRPETLRDPRFAGTWRLGDRGNVLFAHRDADGAVTGFEIKNSNFTGFSPGGHKSAWQSAALGDESGLIIAESAVDALSHAQLYPLRAWYLSTAGTMSRTQRATLLAIFERLAPAALVVAAVDADAGGDQLALEIAQLAEASGRRPFVRHSPDPADAKDWNDVLRAASGSAPDDAPLPPELTRLLPRP